MKKTKNLLLAVILSALIISSCACDIETSSPEISESSSSVSDISVPDKPIVSPTATLSSNVVPRGGYFTVKIENIDLSNFVFTDSWGNEHSFFEKDGAWYCFIGIKASTDAGYYPFNISYKELEFSTTVTVSDKNFKKQYLVVEQQTLEATLEDTAVREDFAKFVDEKISHFSEKGLWDGEFINPLGELSYKETTSYGTFRTFSSGRTEWHDATDMAIRGGTPVFATNSGKVLFAGYLGLSGNTVIIDHGCSIMSWHYHLNEISVAEGDFIEKNTEIGKVGTTGLSTGNHLHFGITVGGVFVDPIAMLETEPYLDFTEVN